MFSYKLERGTGYKFYAVVVKKKLKNKFYANLYVYL